VDAEHAGQQRGGQVGGEVEQGGRPGLAGVDAELAQSFGDAEGADGAAGLAAGERVRVASGSGSRTGSWPNRTRTWSSLTWTWSRVGLLMSEARWA
jgi:hypothetical protein